MRYNPIFVFMLIPFFGMSQEVTHHLRYQVFIPSELHVDTDGNAMLDSAIAAITNNPQYIDYYFDDTWVGLSAGDEGKEEIEEVIFRMEDMMQFYIDRSEGVVQVDSQLFGDYKGMLYDSEYEVELIKEHTKTILGFECFQVDVTEHLHSKFGGGSGTNFYRLYVTPELSLVGSIVCGFQQNVLKYCPLQVDQIFEEDGDFITTNILAAVLHEPVSSGLLRKPY